MSRVMGPKGPLMYSPRTDSLTYPAAQETYDPVGTALPTSEPVENQISYTVQESDLPVSTDKAAAMKFTALLYGGGRNTGVSSATVYYRVLKNGSSVMTGNASVAANNYYTISCYQLYDVKVGDVIELRLWASAATLDHRYKAMVVIASRYVPGGVLNQLLLNFQFLPSSTGYQVALSQGASPQRLTTGNAYIYVDKIAFNSSHLMIVSFTESYRHAAFVCAQDRQFFQLQYGDSAQSVGFLTSTTSFPYYYSGCRLAGTIAYTPTGIFIP